MNAAANTYADVCTAAIQAMLNRANAVLAMDHPGILAESISFWKGYAKALNDLTSGVSDKITAKDAASGGYVRRVGKADWASQTVGNELRTVAQSVEKLKTQGLQITTQAVAQFKPEDTQEFPHSAIAAVQLDDEHSTAPIDVNDGSGRHDERLVVIGVDIVAEGGVA
ncbi:hypothetical protein [Polaromonas hydrogenivorans]|uniref:Uncharacterized protein n=1 Tax=Polaromonas hydrogenivorans TaxID=335476 RepID=A0AAU7LW57_9BURK